MADVVTITDVRRAQEALERALQVGAPPERLAVLEQAVAGLIARLPQPVEAAAALQAGGRGGAGTAGAAAASGGAGGGIVAAGMRLAAGALLKPVPEPPTVSWEPLHGPLGLVVSEPVPAELLDACAGRLAEYLQHGVVATSELAVMSFHSAMWMLPLVLLFQLNLWQDSHDPSSSGKCRPDAVFYKRSALCGKVEAKASDSNIEVASRELVAKLRPDVGRLFPARQEAIPGFAVSRTRAVLFAISRVRTAQVLAEYPLNSPRDRFNFLGVALQVGRWMAAVTGPTDSFHLPHSCETTTRNQHSVFLDAAGLRKTHNKDSHPNMELIRKVYASPEAVNVERGRVVSSHVLVITSVGIPLKDAIDHGLTSRAVARAQVRLGLNQLHGLGVAHCDVRYPNVFFLDNTVFLGDLEYCTPVDEPPPSDRRRAGISTARDLDEVQYEEFCVDLRD